MEHKRAALRETLYEQIELLAEQTRSEHITPMELCELTKTIKTLVDYIVKYVPDP